MISMELASKSVVSALFSKRTSEIQFALFEGVEVGEGGLDELGGQPHCYGLSRRVGSELDVEERERQARPEASERRNRWCVWVRPAFS